MITKYRYSENGYNKSKELAERDDAAEEGSFKFRTKGYRESRMFVDHTIRRLTSSSNANIKGKPGSAALDGRIDSKAMALPLPCPALPSHDRLVQVGAKGAQD